MNRWIKALTAALLFGVLAACGGDDDPAPAATTLPAAPSGLSVAPGDKVNVVQWVAVPTATSYTIYWSETSPVTKATATAIPNAVSPYTHSGLTNGKLLYYAVAARNSAGESDLSTVVSAAPVGPVPAAPASLSVTPGDKVNTVQWAAVPTATSYTIYWSETSPLTKATATAIPNAVSPYAHSGLTNGKLLYYAVTARNAAGESDFSSVIGAMPVAPVPAAPSSLNASAANAAVTLAWSPVSGADSYNVYWSKAAGVVPGAAGVTKIDKVATTNFAHTGLTNFDKYYYIVTAVNTGGESVASPEVSATPMPPAPGAPANFAATSGDAQVQLIWSPVADATSYNVYWSKTAGVVAGGAGVTKIPALTTTSYTHTGLTNGDTYYYIVSATGLAGEGAASAEKSARPLPPPPPAPLGLTAIAAKDAAQVTVQWYDVPNYPSSTAPIQLGYNLYRGLQPGVATYFQDATRANKFANVTAPFIDSTVTTATTYYYVVTAFVPTIPDVESVPSGEVSAAVGRAGGSGGGGGGEPTSTFGNNLSVPLVFADSYGLTGALITGVWPGPGPFTTVPAFDFNTGLRPLSTEVLTAFPYYDASTAVAISGVTYYPQGSASTWQAEWRNNAAGAQLEVIVDWGDALLSKSYTTSSMVRIETLLKQDATIPSVIDTMTAYTMKLLSGQETTELQGTDKSTYASATRNLFAINARLKVEKLAADGTTVDAVLYDKAVYEGFGSTTEGGGGGRTNDSPYTAELNQGGLIVYGKNFYMSQVTGVAQKTGLYRITFSLDPEATVGSVKVPNHIKMVNKADAGATLSADGLSTSVVITVN
ncbi:MAG: fibronectin type III domain-containing protein [Betaproteobacteria bacterium]